MSDTGFRTRGPNFLRVPGIPEPQLRERFHRRVAIRRMPGGDCTGSHGSMAQNGKMAGPWQTAANDMIRHICSSYNSRRDVYISIIQKQFHKKDVTSALPMSTSLINWKP